MFYSSDNVAPSNKTILSVAASLTFSAVALRLVDHIPNAIETFLFSRIRILASRFTLTLTVLIKDSNGFTPNHMFDASMVYLGTKLSPLTTRIDVHKPAKEEALVVNIDVDQELVDTYMGVKLKWILIMSKGNPLNDKTRKAGKEFSKPGMRYFQLSFHKKHRDLVLKSYLPWILKRAKETRDERKVVKLHTVDYNGSDYWGAINLNHPATFDTMAMDRKLKEDLMDDLDRFRNGNGYYRRVGRAWKRGYLLYGPPGTGKSSLVAAMANYLKYDVYDLDLNEVQCSSDLRRLLIGTGNKSIIVIEDIDCRKESSATDDEKITLSGLLNFVDGLWSCCGDERIIVFTTNHKDRLDPALLRAGRMDVHIHMSYCTFDGFKTLAFNFLQINDSPLFGEVKHLLKNVQATPAEIAGELMKTRDSETALRGLIEFLRFKIDGGEEKAKS